MIRILFIAIFSISFSNQIFSQKFKGYLWGDTASYIVYSSNLNALEPNILDSIILVNSAKNYNWVLFFPNDTTANCKKPESKWLNTCGIGNMKRLKSNHIKDGKLYIFEYMYSEYTELYSVEIKKGLGHGRYSIYKYGDNGIELSVLGYLSKSKSNGMEVSLEAKSKYPGISYWKNGKFLCGYSYYHNGNKKSELNRKESKRWSIDGSLIFFAKLGRTGVKEVIISRTKID